MLYRKNATTYTVHEVRGQNPRVSIPEGADLTDLGYQTITPAPRPAFDPVREDVREIDPVDGVQQWQTYPLPPEVLAANLAAQAQAARDNLKAARADAVASITVTTAAGNTFDGDETSQTRMARAVLAMQATETHAINWVLADNTVVSATVAELTEAMVLAGAEQARLWVLEGVHAS